MAVDEVSSRTTRSPGEFLTFCSTNLHPRDSGTACTTLCRIVLCLSHIRPGLGVQAFRMWPRVSGALLHFGQVSSMVELPALLTTNSVGSRFNLPLSANL